MCKAKYVQYMYSIFNNHVVIEYINYAIINTIARKAKKYSLQVSEEYQVLIFL